ncbi:hypothetical protein RN001_002919 [Aquatica leii]|uniref:Apin n=1 Tax=Aquatica leii TaxID=1421715 RepID=A0AAN7SRE9_9COLE|nr:hypothetical protein RN001_002919 [Aquatica leii]
MKFLVLFIICLDVCLSKAGTTEVKPSLSNVNAIQLPQKQEMIYHDSNQQTFVPMQIIQKPLFVPQQPTMLIIAQPTYVPQSFLYGNPTVAQQQLLNYFHNNPQARYQFLYGGFQPHPTMQPYVTHNQLGSSSIATYQIVPNPILNNYNHAVPSYGQVGQLTNVPYSFSHPIRSVPPIITGFENFTPEQQVQIKAQLSAHLGAPLATTAPLSSTTQGTTVTNQDKNTQASTSFTPSLMYRTQYTKG